MLDSILNRLRQQRAQLSRTQVLAAAIGAPVLYVSLSLLFRRRKRRDVQTGFSSFLKEPAAIGSASAGAGAKALHGHVLMWTPQGCHGSGMGWLYGMCTVIEHVKSSAAALRLSMLEIFYELCSVKTRRNAHAAGALTATDFGSFLKRGAASAVVAQPAAGAADGPPLTPESVVVTILFGTEYGFSKEIAEKLRDALRAHPPYW